MIHYCTHHETLRMQHKKTPMQRGMEEEGRLRTSFLICGDSSANTAVSHEHSIQRYSVTAPTCRVTCGFPGLQTPGSKSDPAVPLARSFCSMDPCKKAEKGGVGRQRSETLHEPHEATTG